MQTPRTPARAFLWLLALAVPLVAGAQTRVDERHALSAGGRIELENVAGSIQVRGWDRDEVALSGELGADLRLETDASRDRVQYRVVYPRDSRGDRQRSARLELRVPRGAELQVSAVSAGVDIAEVDLRRLGARSVSGKVAAAGRAGESELTSVSGAVLARLATSRLKATSVSGQVDADGVDGEASLETVSGRVQLGASRIERLQAQSVSGAIVLRVGALAPGGRVAAESVSGRIELTLPADTSAALRATTFSGGIQAPSGEVERPKYGPGRRLETQLGRGNGDITLTSHSGAIGVGFGGR